MRGLWRVFVEFFTGLLSVNSRRSLKDSLYGAFTVARLRHYGYPFPVVAPTGGDEDRVLIGPANSAGQGYAWARALERARPRTRVTSMQFTHVDGVFGYPVDLAVLDGFGAHSSKWQKEQERALGSYRAVVVESALPLLGGRYGANTFRQVTEIKNRGAQVALLFHGSDLRDPDTHLATEPLSYFSADEAFTAAMRDRTRRSRELVQATGLPVFVSTPDLLHEVSGAIWLPVVVDVDAWSGAAPPLGLPRKPVVLHAPSSSHIKGTALVEDTLRELHDDGVIDYRPASGVPHAQMRDLVREADIVIDQFRGGPYGVAACEAMAAGRVVVSHVREEVRERTFEASGWELPIVEAVPQTLHAVIRRLAADPGSALELGERGSAFARHWHDGSHSGDVLAQWLDGKQSAVAGRM